jgi:hypothetical protein
MTNFLDLLLKMFKMICCLPLFEGLLCLRFTTSDGPAAWSTQSQTATTAFCSVLISHAVRMWTHVRVFCEAGRYTVDMYCKLYSYRNHYYLFFICLKKQSQEKYILKDGNVSWLVLVPCSQKPVDFFVKCVVCLHLVWSKSKWILVYVIFPVLVQYLGTRYLLLFIFVIVNSVSCFVIYFYYWNILVQRGEISSVSMKLWCGNCCYVSTCICW